MSMLSEAVDYLVAAKDTLRDDVTASVKSAEEKLDEAILSMDSIGRGTGHIEQAKLAVEALESTLQATLMEMIETAIAACNAAMGDS
jgi:hypothetical protein